MKKIIKITENGLVNLVKEIISEQTSSVPFKNADEGNEFRSWVRKNYPNVATATQLSPTGEYNNSYITNAWKYKVGNQTIGEKYFYSQTMNKFGFNWADDSKKDNSTGSPNKQSSVPFKNAAEGNEFRSWVNKEFPSIAKQYDLSLSGPFNNINIQNVYNHTVGNETLGYKYSYLKPFISWSSKLGSNGDYQTDTKGKAPKCVSIGVGGEDWCSQISTSVGVTIAAGKEDIGCSRFARECLDDYRNGLRFGDAWDAIDNLGDWLGFSQGKLKYNMYNDLDWSKIYDLIKKNNITKSMCEKYFSKSATDGNNQTINNMIKNSGIIPSSSSISVSSLELGDFVGIYYPYSKSMGHAFCQKLKQKGIDNNSNVSNKSPFTFNTHIGFVGAIKNGEPIIFHQTYDKYRATPAKTMLNKGGSDGMIAWVRQNPTVSSKTKKLMEK